MTLASHPLSLPRVICCALTLLSELIFGDDGGGGCCCSGGGGRGIWPPAPTIFTSTFTLDFYLTYHTVVHTQQSHGNDECSHVVRTEWLPRGVQAVQSSQCGFVGRSGGRENEQIVQVQLQSQTVCMHRTSAFILKFIIILFLFYPNLFFTFVIT